MKRRIASVTVGTLAATAVMATVITVPAQAASNPVPRGKSYWGSGRYDRQGVQRSGKTIILAQNGGAGATMCFRGHYANGSLVGRWTKVSGEYDGRERRPMKITKKRWYYADIDKTEFRLTGKRLKKNRTSINYMLRNCRTYMAAH